MRQHLHLHLHLLACALALALAACHELPDLGTCGNGIVEAELGEACDGDRDCTATCEVRCAEEGACPLGQVCAIDGVCRGPSGEFFPLGNAQVFDVKAAITGDFDGDLVDDLVGVSNTELAVRYGDVSGTPFDDGFTQSLPFSHGTAVPFDFGITSSIPNYSSPAIAIPTEGLALLASDASTFYPEIEGVFPIPDDVKVRIVVADEQPNPDRNEVVVEINQPSGGVFAPLRSEISSESGEVLVASKSLDTCGQNLKLVDVVVHRDRSAFFLVGRNDNQPNRFVVCVYRNLVKEGDDVIITGLPPTSALLANVDGDPCDELVIARPSTTTTFVEMVDASGASCTLATTVVALGEVPGADEKLLGAGAIESVDARDDLVLTSGVFVLDAGGLTRFASPSLDPWTSAAVLDLDRDGNMDVVATRDREDVDVVRGGREPENRFTADTTRPASKVAPGDFDGDGFGDVALIEGNAGNHQLSILYGGTGILGPARNNSALGGAMNIATIRRFSWGKTQRATDALDDLLVVRSTMTTPRMGGVLIGDPTRLLTMPRFPATSVPSLGALAVGSFDGDRITAAAVRRTGTDTSELTTLELGSTPAPFATHAISGIEIEETRPPRFIHGAGGTVLGVFADDPLGDGPPTAHLVDASGTLCTGEVSSAGLLHPADLDGDGDDELVVNLTGREVRAFDVTGTTTSASCALGDELLVEALEECNDVVRVGETIVAACVFEKRTELYRIADGVRDQDPFGTLDGLVNFMFVGDYNGDGVQDVAIATTRNGIVSVQLFAQCPAHDTRACR